MRVKSLSRTCVAVYDIDEVYYLTLCALVTVFSLRMARMALPMMITPERLIINLTILRDIGLRKSKRQLNILIILF
jgi:hypothetical protein